MVDYFYPPLSNPIQPPASALPLWQSRRDRKHQYAFILENVEPDFVTQSFPGLKKMAIKIEKRVSPTENQLPSAKLSWCAPKGLKKIKIEDPESQHLYY
jgi:hypothetical protein